MLGDDTIFQSDCQLTGKGAATDDRHRVLKDAKAQVGTTPPMPHLTTDRYDLLVLTYW